MGRGRRFGLLHSGSTLAVVGGATSGWVDERVKSEQSRVGGGKWLNVGFLLCS